MSTQTVAFENTGRATADFHRRSCGRTVGSGNLRTASHGRLDRARLPHLSRFQPCHDVCLVLHREVSCVWFVVWFGLVVRVREQAFREWGTMVWSAFVCRHFKVEGRNETAWPRTSDD